MWMCRKGSLEGLVAWLIEVGGCFVSPVIVALLLSVCLALGPRSKGYFDNT